MEIYMLHGGYDYMAYKFEDTGLESKLMGLQSGRVVLPSSNEVPLNLEPGFGGAKSQPVKLGDVHCLFGSARLFSERAVETLQLERTGSLFEADLKGRSEKFFWYWSTTIVDCLNHERTLRSAPHLVMEPAFHKGRVGDAEIFTVPDDQAFQFRIYVTEEFRDRIKKAKLKGFLLLRNTFDPKPWKS